MSDREQAPEPRALDEDEIEHPVVRWHSSHAAGCGCWQCGTEIPEIDWEVES